MRIRRGATSAARALGAGPMSECAPAQASAEPTNAGDVSEQAVETIAALDAATQGKIRRVRPDDGTVDRDAAPATPSSSERATS